MRFSLTQLFSAAAVLLTIAPLAALAQTAELFQRNQAVKNSQQDVQIRQYALVDKAHPSLPVGNLLSLQVEQGNLVLRTPLRDVPPHGKVKIGSADDWTLITVLGGATESGKPVIPGAFWLSRATFSPKQTEIFSLQQFASRSQLISLQVQTPAGSRAIQLQEQFQNAQVNAPGACCLTISEFLPGQPMTPVRWTSDNFTALTFEHPVEVNQYLRPLLQKLDQESVLAPDPMLAFELFADQWTPDAATTAKVDSLVGKLTGGDFHSRAAAEHELAALGKDGTLALLRLDRSKFDAEQNARVDKVLAPYRPVPAQVAAKLRSSPAFLANCLYSDDVVIRKAAFARLLSVTKLPLSFDPAANQADRAAAVAAVQKQLVDAKVTDPN